MKFILNKTFYIFLTVLFIISSVITILTFVQGNTPVKQSDEIKLDLEIDKAIEIMNEDDPVKAFNILNNLSKKYPNKKRINDVIGICREKVFNLKLYYTYWQKGISEKNSYLDKLCEEFPDKIKIISSLKSKIIYNEEYEEMYNQLYRICIASKWKKNLELNKEENKNIKKLYEYRMGIKIPSKKDLMEQRVKDLNFVIHKLEYILEKNSKNNFIKQKFGVIFFIVANEIPKDTRIISMMEKYYPEHIEKETFRKTNGYKKMIFKNID